MPKTVVLPGKNVRYRARLRAAGWEEVLFQRHLYT